jgi:hypothetical protein
MPNLLTTRATLTTGPLFLETLVKHYFAKVVSHGSNTGVPLRREELLYDEAFNIVKVLTIVCFTCESYSTFVIGQRILWSWLRGLYLIISSVVSKCLASDSQTHGRRTAILLEHPYSVAAVGPCRPPRHSPGLVR